jgi:gamma-glutamyl hercynylcysteine S-oxide synthase
MFINSPIVSRALSAEQLHRALIDSRTSTKRVLEQWRQVTNNPRARIPLHDEWNLPEWEAGHIAWFQEFWIARNPDRSLGSDAHPDAVRTESLIAESDALFNSSLIGHHQRWKLSLPTEDELEEYLDQSLKHTLIKLTEMDEDKNAHNHSSLLYFFRLALYHEDMHAEAAHYSINHYVHEMGIDPLATGHLIQELQADMQRSLFADYLSLGNVKTSPSPDRLYVQTREHQFGAQGEKGFAFDNELAAFVQSVEAFSIDARPVSVSDYLAFIQSDGYHKPQYWSDVGWAWKSQQQAELPRFHRLIEGQLERCCSGKWVCLPPASPIVHVTAYEAEAWCAWAGKRLPTEHEWTVAVTDHPESFVWGQVWEWTQSEFAPFPGFVAHPYRDYSQPWFTGHRVLKGASFATHPRMRNPVYRNFYIPSRNDIYAGFRTCAR